MMSIEAIYKICWFMSFPMYQEWLVHQAAYIFATFSHFHIRVDFMCFTDYRTTLSKEPKLLRKNKIEVLSCQVIGDLIKMNNRDGK